MLSMNEMIFTYKSEIYIFIRSESNNEEITPNNNIYIDGEETLAEGVMLGLKSPRYLNEDGSFSGISIGPYGFHIKIMRWVQYIQKKI